MELNCLNRGTEPRTGVDTEVDLRSQLGIKIWNVLEFEDGFYELVELEIG